jgi:hypothetical protein
MSMMNIPPGKPPQVDLATLMQSQAAQIEQGIKNNLPKLFEKLATNGQ